MESGFKLRPAGPRVHLVALGHFPPESQQHQHKELTGVGRRIACTYHSQAAQLLLPGSQVRWNDSWDKGSDEVPQGSPFDCFHVLAAGLGVWQQRQWLGMCKTPARYKG